MLTEKQLKQFRKVQKRYVQFLSTIVVLILLLVSHYFVLEVGEEHPVTVVAEGSETLHTILPPDVDLESPHIMDDLIEKYGSFMKVSRVVDGDTIEVLTTAGLKKVRLIGIDTPESVDPRKPVECFGEEATMKMKDLVEGKKVLLIPDDTQSLNDIYNRALRYVYLEDGTLVNFEMIRLGFGYEYTYKVPYWYQEHFQDAEARARSQKLGLWQDGVCTGQN